MANVIRIKRRSTDATAPTTSQAVNGELAFNENNDILYYGKGGNSTASSSVIKIGGSGAFLTTDTNQTPTGTKTFSTTTLKITGGSSNQVLTTDGSGNVSWASVASNAYANISDGTTTASASGSDTVKFRATSPLTVTVGSNDVTHGDNVLYGLGTVTTANGGTGLTSYTAGDLPYYSTGTALTKLGIGSAGNYLKVVSGAPSWANFDTDVNARSITSFTFAPLTNLSLNDNKITNLATPTASTDAANKSYVDSVAQGLHVHATADAATTARLGSLAGVAVSYSAGTQAITWTAGTAATAAGFTDGVTLTASTTESSASRILVKNEGDASGLGAAYNGIYYVYGARELRRTTDGNAAADYAGGDFCYVVNGTLYEATGWVQTEKVVTLDTTSIIWQQFSGAGTITAGAGLTATGTTINVATANSGRIVINPDNIDLATVTQSNSSGTAGINFVQSQTVDSYGRVSATVSADVRTGSTSQTGILQLTDSTSSTSTTTAATPNSVKTSYDLANAALPKSGGTMTGKLIGMASTTSVATMQFAAGVDPTLPQVGDIWFNSASAVFKGSTAGSNAKVFAFTDSNITGTAANVTGTVAIANGGTGQTTAQAAINALAGATTSGQFLRGNGTNVVMASIQAGDVPTLNQNTTGTAANVTGTVAIANGGTGATTQQAAINALAGAVTSGQFLRGNGTNVLMGAIQAGDVPTLNQNTTGTASNVTGVVAVANGGTGLTSLGSGITSWLGSPTSANLAAAVTDETGSGSLVFGTNPTLGLPRYSINAAVSAAGTTQGTATALTADINVVTTATGGSATGVVLPTAVAGMRVIVRNATATAISVYPATGAAIDGSSANAALTVTTQQSFEFVAISSTEWRTFRRMTDGQTLRDNDFAVGTSAFNFVGTSLTTKRSYVLPDVDGNIAITGNKLSDFAATSSAQLAGVISDETGSGSLVFGTQPTLSQPVIDNIRIGYASTATSAGTLTLTNTSGYRQLLTGTTTHTVVLPVVTTLANGQGYEIHNNSTGAITVQSSGANTIYTINAGQTVLFTCINTAGGTGTASWDFDITGASASTGSGSLVYATSPTLVTPALGTPASGNLSNCTNIPVAQATGTLPTANGGTGLTSFTTNGAVYATSTSALTTGTLPVASGGTGATTFTSKGVLYGNGTSAVQVTAAATWDSTNLVGQFLKADSSNNPIWSDTVDGGGY